jgi:murein DD-endopeptidase MepM/ murein hydrolase activator NlpD
MMRTGLRFSAWVLAVGVCIGAGADQQSDGDILLTLSHAAPLRIGDAVLVSVTASQPLTTLEGEAFGRPVPFWATTSQRQWNGLVGIDVGVGAGTYDLEVRATGLQGAAARATLSLLVGERRFETRQVRVAERFVNPPEGEAERIRQEAERLAAVFMRSQAARLWRGPFTLPVPGSSTSSFGRLTVMNGKPGGRHRGVDFRAAEGIPVRAPNSGLVVLAADLYFSGNTVIVDHGAGLVSLFAHLSRIAVDEGMQVSGGDLLGQAGSTGRVTGPHLHWAVRLGEASVDPLSLVSALSNFVEPPEF